MEIDTKTIKKYFQKSIDKYSENAVVQKLMAQKLCAALPRQNFDTALEIGAGAGLLTEELHKKITYHKYYANDLVEKSEYYVKKYIPNAVFEAGDFKRINYSQKFDLIISNAVFQWFENPEKIFLKCSSLLNTDGILAFSTFLPENFKEFYSITKLSLEYKTFSELQTMLQLHFEIISSEQFEYKMKFENPLQILAHMKNTGVNSLAATKWGIKEVKNFCDSYKAAYSNLELTYNPVIIIAKLK